MCEAKTRVDGASKSCSAWRGLTWSGDGRDAKCRADSDVLLSSLSLFFCEDCGVS